MKNLANKGRLIVIGSVVTYKNPSNTDKMSDSFSGTVSTYDLLAGSKTVSGFFLNNYRSQFPRHFAKLAQLFASGELKVFVDDKFSGLEGIYDAVDYLHSGKNLGKVVVALNAPSAKL